MASSRGKFGLEPGNMDVTTARGGIASTSGAGPSLGTTRNRTELFLKYRRQALAANRPFNASGLPGSATDDDTGLETAKLMASALGGLSDAETGTAGLSAAALAPQYVEFKELCRRDMQEIKERMAALRSLHGRASLSKFDDSKDEEAEVEIATQQMTKLFRRCEARLQDFTRNPAPSTADDKVQKNVQRTLAVELQRLSIQFRKQQKQYLQRLRARDGQSSSAAGALDILDASRAAGGDEDVSFIDPGFSNQQTLQSESMTSLINERDKEVVGIVQSINELAQIMKDLSVLVIDQGTVLDRIDYNLEQTAAGVQQGVSQLRRADRAQRRGTAAACVMILLVAVGAMGLIVLLKAMLA